MPRAHRSKKTRRYSDEFKATAVELSLAKDVQVQTVAEALDIHPFMLSRWRKAYREGLSQLEVEVQRLKKENDVLKKWQRFVAEHPDKDSRS